MTIYDEVLMIDLNTLTPEQHELYLRGIEAAANVLASGMGSRTHFVEELRKYTANARGKAARKAAV